MSLCIQCIYFAIHVNLCTSGFLSLHIYLSLRVYNIYVLNILKNLSNFKLKQDLIVYMCDV